MRAGETGPCVFALLGQRGRDERAGEDARDID
jgi:hypothetical protein